MIKSILTFAVFPLAITAAFAQELPAETSNNIETQEVSTTLSIEGLEPSKQYSVCHRMKNGIANHQIQTATAE
jgi:hypothetical protein